MHLGKWSRTRLGAWNRVRLDTHNGVQLEAQIWKLDVEHTWMLGVKVPLDELLQLYGHFAVSPRASAP